MLQLFLKHTLVIRKDTYDNFITKESSDRRFLLQFNIYFDIRSRKSRQEWINIRRIANNLDIWYSQLASSDFAVCHDRSWPCVLSRRRVVDVVVVASKAGGGERFPRNPREIIVGSWTTAAYLPFSITVLSPRSMCILNFHIDIRPSFATHFSSDLKLLWPRFYEISSPTIWKFHCFNFNSPFFLGEANYARWNGSMKIKFIDFDIL